eukprot:13893271-Alexandrium_andersonii.AAC.1
MCIRDSAQRRRPFAGPTGGSRRGWPACPRPRSSFRPAWRGGCFKSAGAVGSVSVEVGSVDRL